ncbi:MAG: methyltransferase domain-containing protein, partial [Chloroflexota bacterium]
MYAPEARTLLDRFAVRPGWRAVDVGCGPVGILDVLAERVGPTGEVVGVDREPRSVAMARDLVAERGLANVRVVEADASATGLPRSSFDLVHARLVLVTVPDPERVLAEMIALAHVGGWVAVQDLDPITHFCEPPHPAWNAVYEGFLTLQRENSNDVHLGRRLFGMLRAAGLADVDMTVATQVCHAGDFYMTQLPTITRSIWSQLVARRLFTDAELSALVAALERHLADPGTVVVRSLL